MRVVAQVTFVAFIVAVAGNVNALASDPRPTPCAFFADMYPVSDASFTQHHATAKERTEILRLSATVSTPNRKYLRWMRDFDDVLVFVANPNYYDRDSHGYSPWMALGTNILVDPVQCEIHAYPTA